MLLYYLLRHWHLELWGNYFIWEVWTLTAAIMIQLITGAIGSVGFGILFHIKKKYLPLAAVGGFLSWLVFLLGKEFWGMFFFRR